MVLMTKEGSTKILNFMTIGAWVRGNMSYSENALFHENTSSKLLHINQNNKTLGRVYQNCKFLTPVAGVFLLWHGQIIHVLKIYHFLKNILLYCCAYVRQTEYIIMMNKERSIKTVNFMIPGLDIFFYKIVICQIVKMHYFFIDWT